ncbi:MAG: hypothetical protein LBK70_03540 [Clostridiales bacterium]|jgi:sporulation protein YlmC with PRC-barrel domain|nr:hypothetical protein [Clostridiales bacterium]
MTLSCSIRDIIGKRVVCLSDASSYGTIHSVNFDNKQTAQNIIVHSIDNTTFGNTNIQTKYIDIKDIYSIGQIVVFKYPDQVKYVWNTRYVSLNCPIGASVYSQDGELLGELLDITLQARRIHTLLIQGNVLPNFGIISMSQDIVLVNTTNMRINTTKCTSIPKAPKQNQQVQLH